MRKSRHGLHLYRVPLVQRVIEHSWSVDNLPLLELVLSMAHKEILSGESIRLHIAVGICHVVHEARLADVWETCHDE